MDQRQIGLEFKSRPNTLVMLLTSFVSRAFETDSTEVARSILKFISHSTERGMEKLSRSTKRGHQKKFLQNTSFFKKKPCVD